MRWKGGRRSDNVEDRRGMSVAKGAAGGGIGVVLIAVVAMLFGVDPSQILNQFTTSDDTTQNSATPATSKVSDELGEFVSVVLADTEDTWHELFRQMGRTYTEPKLVLFTGAVQSACGYAQSATGPFYCSGDQKVYIDLGFYNDLKNRFKAPGDFAQAYVIAHEIGHHVQNLLGILPQVHEARSQADKVTANALLVKLELQADCLAGVWAYHADKARNVVEAGDVEEALRAASSIGDDRLQMQAQGYVVPDAFTHGTSEQRARWFTQGLKSGNPNMCNTFQAKNL
ncbi:MAG: neutral zinc metallopeptidase [Candidatus Vecturithrix sp.]|nr:neutral zinc metallopeptidase [Candidatus Vecturithrix sp.]